MAKSLMKICNEICKKCYRRPIVMPSNKKIEESNALGSYIIIKEYNKNKKKNNVVKPKRPTWRGRK